MTTRDHHAATTGAPPASRGITLVALLYLHAGRNEEYERFETVAARIMRRHGGRLERRIAFPAQAATAARDGWRQPDEMHVVSFRDPESFARYRADPEIQALAELRAAAIRDTVLWQGREGRLFDEPTTVSS